MKLFSFVSFITLQILGFFHQLVLILIFYGVTVKTKNIIHKLHSKGLKKDAVFVSRHVKGVPFFNGRYTKGVPFLSKMVYKRVRGLTSGRSLPV